MSLNTYQISLTFEQILELVKQLPSDDKVLLSKELTKEILNQKLTKLLEVFETDELDLETINQELETVRAAIYAESETN